MGYPYKAEFRAQCVNVVDGDTIDLIVDRGFRDYTLTRFRFARINAYEMKAPDEKERDLAKKAKEQLITWLKPVTVLNLKGDWSVRILTKKDPDEYGRWLAEVFFFDDTDKTEKCANDELLKLGLAKLYKK